MSAAIASHVAERVRVSMGELSNEGSTLVALGNALEEMAALPGNAEPGEIQHVAVGVNASALRIVTAALVAAVVAERLATLARVLAVDTGD